MASDIGLYRNIFKQFCKWAKVVKFSHTIFALPFALSILFIIASKQPITLIQTFWIVVCLVSARTLAMACNRLLDHDIDALNPRTMSRELPSGEVTVVSVKYLFISSALIFIFGAGMLGIHTLILAPFVIAVLCFYSWTKRFTQYSHLVLGICLGMAPGGVWYALVGTIEMTPLWLMLGVVFWVAGFDVIYSCQDVDFDKKQGLFSIPTRVGVVRSLLISKLMHVLSLIFLYQFGQVIGLGSWYMGTIILFGVIVFSQHLIVKADDLSRVNEAFFVRNGIASVIFLLGTLLDLCA